jgi:hypothetical protein
LPENAIISALFAQITASSNGHSSPQNHTSIPPGVSLSGDYVQQAASLPSAEAIDAISSALLHWGELPDFGPQGLTSLEQGAALPFLGNEPGEIDLLPEDMYAFFEEHARTDPQLELPWWLRKITVANGDAETSRPIDQESIRTNRLVQRWVERWGRQSQPSSLETFSFSSESVSEDASDER